MHTDAAVLGKRESDERIGLSAADAGVDAGELFFHSGVGLLDGQAAQIDGPHILHLDDAVGRDSLLHRALGGSPDVDDDLVAATQPVIVGSGKVVARLERDILVLENVVSENLLALFLYLLLYQKSQRIGEKEVHAAHQFILPFCLRHLVAVFLILLQRDTPVVDRSRTAAGVLRQRRTLPGLLLLGVLALDAVHLIHRDSFPEELRNNVLVGSALLAGFNDELHNLLVRHFLLRTRVRNAREHTCKNNDVSSHEN